MPQEQTFRELIRRVRAGEQAAMTELVRRYAQAVRVAVRVRLTDPALRRLFDSSDICQSVLANFFVRATAGQFRLDSPEQLLRLLAEMARNRLKNEVHKHQAQRRDYRRQEKDAGSARQLADPGPGPDQEVLHQDLVAEFRRRLTPEERSIADQRAQEQSWAEIAAERGESPDAVRVRFNRAVDRVTRELHLDE